jgi:hypothetical protein
VAVRPFALRVGSVPVASSDEESGFGMSQGVSATSATESGFGMSYCVLTIKGKVVSGAGKSGIGGRLLISAIFLD